VSEVTLLIDRDQAIPVLNTRTGTRSVAYGDPTAQGGLLELRFMPAGEDVGDLLTTSGIDGVYPPGLPVARVASVDRQRQQLRPHPVPALAQLQGVTHVMVLTPMAAARAARPPRPPSCARHRRRTAPGPRQARGRHRQSGGQGPPRRQASLRLEGARHDHAPRPAAAAAGRPGFIWGSLLVALMLNLLPLGRVPWMPDFWRWCWCSGPSTSRAAWAWGGLRLRAADGRAPGRALGQHALAYTVLIYFAIMLHRRMLWFGCPARRCSCCRCSRRRTPSPSCCG
jgi:hypothetical protein